MFNTQEYDTDFSVDSKNSKVSIGFMFNGATTIVSGFNNSTTGHPGGILGSCFKPVSLEGIGGDTYPMQSGMLPKPIGVDLIYRFAEQDVVLMENSGDEIVYAAFTLGAEASFLSHISSTAIIVECQARPAGAISRDDFTATSDFKVVNNTIGNTSYPIDVTCSFFKVMGPSDISLKEWPETTTIPDLTELVYESCSIPVYVYNDSKPKVNKIGSYNGVLIKIKLKDTIKDVIDTLFSVSQDTLFRVVINPIFTTHTSVVGKSRIVYPDKSIPVDDLTHLVFTSVKSRNESPTHYRVIVKSGDVILVDGSSTGEYHYNNIVGMNEDINPFRFFYSDKSKVNSLQTGQIRYDGSHNPGTGVPKDTGVNIIVEVNENLAFKLRSFSSIEVEIYSNDGVRGYTTNLWSLN